MILDDRATSRTVRSEPLPGIRTNAVITVQRPLDRPLPTGSGDLVQPLPHSSRRSRHHALGRPMTVTVDTVVMGAGVVGLACAHSLARAGRG